MPASHDVIDGMITIRMDFACFEDFWTPMEGKDGSFAEYFSTLSIEGKSKLRDAVRLAYLDGEIDGRAPMPPLRGSSKVECLSINPAEHGQVSRYAFEDRSQGAGSGLGQTLPFEHLQRWSASPPTEDKADAIITSTHQSSPNLRVSTLPRQPAYRRDARA